MCDYCGCREFPLIGQLSAEHEQIANAAGRLRTAILREYPDRLARLDDLLALLHPHTSTEETGLFAELRAEGSLTEAVERLCAEHDDIHGVLNRVERPPDWPAVLAALDRLRRHIDNEEHGLFPLPLSRCRSRRGTVSPRRRKPERVFRPGIRVRVEDLRPGHWTGDMGETGRRSRCRSGCTVPLRLHGAAPVARCCQPGECEQYRPMEG